MGTRANMSAFVSEVLVSAMLLLQITMNLNVRYLHGFLRYKFHRGQLKYDVTRAENRFRLSAKRTSPFQSAGGRQFSRLLAAEVCASAVVMLDTPYSEVV